ncbi:MAG: DUF2461 domain-containing protein [Nitrosomonadales bacterium]|nr:DUF2461 domain-containing protein [Nitrosomonadales bacterium]
MPDRYFTKQTFAFLSTLAANNNREWFEEHKQEYEDCVRTPALDFIADMANELPAISKHFRALPKKVGGSLMRVQRDTRFSKDKTPYKTNIGIQFRHEVGKDIHAPGYYVHIEPGDCFVGIGLWHPDADALFRIREGIVKNDEAWVLARDDKDFRKHFELVGDVLANAPRGFAKDHPLVEDLKFKDFIGLAKMSDAQVTAKDFREQVVARFKQAAPYMGFLCKALELRF